MIWPRILAVTSRLLHKHKINFNYLEDITWSLSMRYLLITIFAEFLNLKNYQISIFPEVWKLWISGNMQISNHGLS